MVACLMCVFGLPHAGSNLSTSNRIVGVLVAGVLLLTWYRRAHQRRIRSEVRVCAQCNLVKLMDYQETCLCGGKFSPLCELQWLEKPALTDDRFPELNPQTAIRASHAV
jgi:hypothetical protein